MNALPEQIGRYQILGLLGTGGMAEVLLGRVSGPSGFERPVVLKRILPHLAREQHFRDMFTDEARIVAQIAHQNVVHVHELGLESGELFLVMEYLEGESAAGLARRLSSKRKLLSFGLCAHVLAEICAGLHAAHTLVDHDGKPQNLVHRDVSPANIFVTYKGDVKILDFGIAVAADRVSRTDAGQVKGKYAYMSPEQCMGHRLDCRSDVFSLGIVLYELSTCRRLFKRPSDMVTLQAICHEEVLPPSKLVQNYPPELERIVLKALERDKDKRYQTAHEMRRDLVAVSRELNQGKLPEESLAKVMQKLFADRIEQKRSLLAKLDSGEAVSAVPAAETDSAIDLPAAAFTGPEAEPVSKSAVSIPSTVAPKPRRSLWIGAAAGAVVVLAAAAVLTAGGPGLAVQEPAATMGAAALEAPSRAEVPSAPEQPPEAPALSPRVTMRLETEPPGATVMLGERLAGRTPTELELPRSATPVTLTLRLAGHRTQVEELVPDMDQKLRVTLMKDEPLAREGRREPQPKKTSAVEKAPAASEATPAVEEKKPPAEEPYQRFEDPYKRFN